MINKVTELPKYTKQLIVLVSDLIILLVSLAMAYMLRYGTIQAERAFVASWPLFTIMTVVGAVIFAIVGLPQIKLRALENRAIIRIAGVSGLLALGAMVASYILYLPTPRSVPLIFGAFFFMIATSGRLLAVSLLQFCNRRKGEDLARVAIYGAGSAGIQLASALRQSHEAAPVFFVDDNPNLQGLVVAGIPVFRPRDLATLLKRYDIKRLLLAMPSVSLHRQEELVSSASAHGVEVQVLPSYIDLMANKGLTAKLKPISSAQLLGRSKVDLSIPEIAKAYFGRVVMVTGAGGSIGGELCRQLLACRPAKIVLYEQGEFALYTIDRDLRPRAQEAGISIVTRIGSVNDFSRVASVIEDEKIEIILHAAAYKHVPLVEENELEGARNNVIGTKIVAEAAHKAGVERFILISTDKAVRPTNIMGATKRMAEMVVQDLQTRSLVTKFAMVRFGNVLGSSGSVLPLFQKQIETGGPVTVTDPSVTRFFMTIPEASRLVLLAGAFAEGGDMFVLDMGKPQKILDIAYKMIELSGRTVKDPVTGLGDIEVEITGLRPGEKLYEELLLNHDRLVKTPHPKILRAMEEVPPSEAIAAMLADLENILKQGNATYLRQLMSIYVEGYHARPISTALAC